MVAIAGEFGLKGEIITIHLLCAVYRNGYFVEWGDLVKFKLLKELPGVSAELLDQVVSRLVRWGFFDEGLFNSAAVLTSSDIQQTYFSATRGRVQASQFPYILSFFARNNTEQMVSDKKTPVSYIETTQSKGNNSKDKETDYVGKEKPKTPQEGEENTSAVKLKAETEKKRQNALNAQIQKRRLRPYAENVEECLASQEWQEMVQMNLGIKITDWQDVFARFRASLVANGHDTEKTLQDFRQHFVNWLRIDETNKRQNEKTNERNEKTVGCYDTPRDCRGIGRAAFKPAQIVPADRGKSVL